MVSGLKLMSLGLALGGILIVSLAGLAAELDIKGEEVAVVLAREQAVGDDSGRAGWLLHCKRMLKVSAFFQVPGKGPRLLASLKVVITVDELSKVLLGKAKQKKSHLVTARRSEQDCYRANDVGTSRHAARLVGRQRALADPTTLRGAGMVGG